MAMRKDPIDLENLRKEAEAYGAMTADMARLEGQLRQQFEASESGVEVKYLKEELLGKILVDTGTFVAQFGQRYQEIARNVAQFHDEKTVRDLISAMRKISSIAPKEELQFFETVLNQLKTGDMCGRELAVCVQQLDAFETYLKAHHPKSDVLRRLQSARELVHLKHYQAELQAWKEILYRLLFKEEFSHKEFDVFAAGEREALRKNLNLKEEGEAWNDSVRLESWEKEVEKKFVDAVKYDAKNAAIWHKVFAQSRQNKAVAVAGRIRKMMTQPFQSEEVHNGRLQLAGIIQSHLKHINSLFENERISLVHAIQDRIRDIERKHANALQTVERFEDHRRVEVHDIATAIEVEQAGAQGVRADAEEFRRISQFVLALANQTDALAQQRNPADVLRTALLPAFDQALALKQRQAALYRKLQEDAERVEAMAATHSNLIDTAADRAARERKEVDDVMREAA